VLLYDFDSVTGTVSNGITLISSNPYGVEFSSKTKKLYVTENHFDSGGDKIVESALIQFDLKNTNIPSSKTVIETSPLYISGSTIGH
jgi:DNA-binding beta-propeller fold protein YncE